MSNLQNNALEFSDATITKKANVYYDGKVSSRTVVLQSGERKTLGFMMPGNYTFNTGAPELMELLAGEADVWLSPNKPSKKYHAGESFSVPENASFQISVTTYLDYCCSYLK